MPEKRTDLLYIEDILTCLKKISKYIENHDFNSFVENQMVQDAVIRNLEIIGEASRNLTDKTKQKAAKTPWNRMIGLRNIVTHKYFSIDLEIVWKIITENLKETEPEIAELKDLIND